MPLGDKTGPKGKGKMTGRKLGYCAGYDEAGYTKPTDEDSPRIGQGRRIKKNIWF